MRIRTPSVPRRLDEAGGGDRLARRGRVAEAVATRRARVLAGEAGSSLVVVVDLAGVEVVVLLLELGARRPRRRAPLPSCRCRSRPRRPSRWFAAISSVSIPASASIWWRAQLGAGGGRRRLRGEHALEPEHQAVADLPARRRRAAAGFDLGERIVERGAARGAGSEGDGRVLAGVEEGLAGPVLRAKRVGSQAVRRVRRDVSVSVSLRAYAQHDDSVLLPQGMRAPCCRCLERTSGAGRSIPELSPAGRRYWPGGRLGRAVDRGARALRGR